MVRKKIYKGSLYGHSGVGMNTKRPTRRKCKLKAKHRRRAARKVC